MIDVTFKDGSSLVLYDYENIPLLPEDNPVVSLFYDCPVVRRVLTNERAVNFAVNLI